MDTDLGNGIQFGGSIGYVALPGIAYLLRDFRLIQLATTIPLVFFLTGWFFIPESPRWLLLNGRVSEAEAIVRSAAITNRLPVTEIKEQMAQLGEQFLLVSA